MQAECIATRPGHSPFSQVNEVSRAGVLFSSHPPDCLLMWLNSPRAKESLAFLTGLGLSLSQVPPPDSIILLRLSLLFSFPSLWQRHSPRIWLNKLKILDKQYLNLFPTNLWAQPHLFCFFRVGVIDLLPFFYLFLIFLVSGLLGILTYSKIHPFKCIVLWTLIKEI